MYTVNITRWPWLMSAAHDAISPVIW